MVHSEKPAAASRDASRIAFGWLLQLRWAAVVCQVVVIGLVSRLLAISVPLPILFVVIAFQALSNCYFHYLQRRQPTIPEALFGFVMLWDVMLLTLLLYYTGGPMNPFTFLYLVHVALGALLMRPAWAWGLTLVTVGAYAALFYLIGASPFPLSSSHIGRPVCIDALAGGHSTGLDIHLRGMWVAFSITAMFIVSFIGRVQKDLAVHRASLARLREEKHKSDRLASLATLSAGAAHEFSTPLATIAVAAGEMLHTLRQQGAAPELIDDVLLIRGQVQRCRKILDQLSADAGEHAGVPIEPVTVGELVEMLLYEFREETDRQVEVDNQVPDLTVAVPVDAFVRSIRGLLKNAADAAAAGRIVLRCRQQAEYLLIEVEDDGPGMDDETRRRAAEPFFTTKSPGRGLGLGLFLAKSMAEQLGGGMEIVTRPAAGCRVILQFSLAELTADRQPARFQEPDNGKDSDSR